jgi:lactoylglutathione lyase
VTKPIHMMVRVFDLGKSLDFYRRAFGMEEVHRLDFDEFALVYLRHPESAFELELTWNKSRKEPYALGDGYGHIAFSVDDLAATHARLRASFPHVQDIKELKTKEGRTLARFFFTEDPDGYKIEVLQRGGHYQ